MLYPLHYGSDPLFPQASDFAVVDKDDTSGKGVITYRDFRAGEVLARLAGDIVSDVRQHTLQIAPDRHLLDVYFCGYFLHSCAPNVDVDMQALTVTARTDIPAGSFIYMDYLTTEDTLFKQFRCSCGAPDCRGWIKGKQDFDRPIDQLNQANPVERVL